uniref:Uncharacterized protein n=1 Tax=Arundo donax TaxID=35708 RepID=A0A0A9G0L2_ARUDO
MLYEAFASYASGSVSFTSPWLSRHHLRIEACPRVS